MNTIKLSNYGVTITNANIGKVNEQVDLHPVNEPLILDFDGIRGIDSKVANELLTSLHSRQGGQVFIKNTEPMVKSVLIFSGQNETMSVATDAPIRKSASRHFALFGRLFSLLLLFALSFGFNQEAKAWGWTQYASQDPATVYVGKTVTLTMWLNSDANGASYKRFGYGTTNSKAGLTWSENWTYKEKSGENHKWEFNFIPTSSGTWYWSLWIGWGSSVGDNGRYYNNNTNWNEGKESYTSSSITVLAIPQPTNQTATADKNTINLSWSKNTPGHNVMVVRSTSSTAPSPTAGKSYSVGSTISTGYTVVYNSNGTSYSDENLDYGTKYYYYFFSEHYSYYSTSVSANATTPSTYTVTYDANGATSGSAPTDATEYVSGSTVTVKSNSGSLAKTGYSFSGWNTKTDGSGTTYAAGTGTFSITANTTLYAKWTENTHNITISNDGHGSTTPSGAQSNVGEVTGIQITATPNDDYGFKEWVVSGGTISAQSATTTFKPTADNATIQATFQSTAVYYTWGFGVYQSTGGTVESTVAAGDHVQGGTSITLTASPATGYEVDGWYDNQTCSGQALQVGQNTYSFTISANSVRYVKFKKTNYAITYTTQSTGWTYGGSNPTTANYGDQVSFVVNQTAGYTVSVTSSDVTLDASAAPTYKFTMPAKAVAISVSATENLTTVTVNANQTTWGTLSGAISTWGATTTAGVATSRTLKATPKSGYKFVKWTLEGGATSSSTLTNASITIKGDGSSAIGTATAEFAEDLSSNWYVEGDATLFKEGWNANENSMMKRTAPNAKSLTWTLTVADGDKTKSAGFKIYQKVDDSNANWWGYGGEDAYWDIRNTDQNGLHHNSANNIYFHPTVAGDYTFAINDITAQYPTLTVTYPSVNELHHNFTGSWTHTAGTLENGVLTVDYAITQAMVDSKLDLEFEMIYEGVYYGPGTDKAQMTATNHTDWKLEALGHGYHVVLKPSIAGTYTFVFDSKAADKNFNVTYPVPDAPTTINVTAERYFGEDKIDNFIATDPAYKVYTDEQIKLTIDEVVAPTGCTTYYQFGDNAASTERTYTISNITTTASSIEAKVFFRPNSGGKDGDATTETINYQGVATPTLYLDADWSEAQEGDEVPENVTIFYNTANYSGPATVTRSKDGEDPVTFMNIASGEQAQATYNLPDQNVQRQTFVATATANGRTFTATKAISVYRLVEIVITDEDHLMNHYYMWENGTNPLHEETAWPGNTFFSTLGNAHIFYVKYPSYTHFVLNDGKQEGAIQTVNVAVPDQSTCYTIGTQITGEEDPDKGKYAVEEAAQCPNKLYVGDIDDVSAVQGEGVIVSPQVDIDPLLNENDLTISFNYGSTQGITCDQRGRSFMVTATAGTDTYHISVTYSIPGADPITKPVTINVTSAIMIQAKYGDLAWSDHNEIYIHYWGTNINATQKMTWKDYVGEEPNKQDRVYARIPLGSDDEINFQIYAWNMDDDKQWHITKDVTGVTSAGCYIITPDPECENGCKRNIEREGDNCWTAYYVEIDMANGTVYRSNTVEDLTKQVSFFAPGSSEPQAKSGLVRIICNGSQTATVSAATFTKSGIYTAKITANGAGLSDVAPYTGDYYIRTDAAEGGWNDYVKDSHKFTYFTPYNGALYDYYWVINKKVDKQGDKLNIKGCVGNDINENLANMIEVSNYTDGYGDIIPDAGTGVNLRFGYNPETNYFERSILRGSTAGSSNFLNLVGENIFNDDKCTKELNESNYTTNPEWSKFGDISNWVYEKNVYVKIEGSQQSAQALLKSKAFNETTIYQLGYTLDNFGRQTGTPAQYDILAAGTTNNTYNIRVIYDFKTNRIVSAWSPIGDVTYDSEININADVLFVRHEGQSVAQVNLSNDAAKVSSLKSAYFVMEIDGSSDRASESIYWFSVPFDCEINSIFGVEGYVTLDGNGNPTAGTWGIQEYDGEARAQKGWYIEDTQTFWRWMRKNETLKKGNGYVLVFDRADADSKHLWSSISREEPCEGTDDGCEDGKKKVITTVLRLYFPSSESGWKMTRSDVDQSVTYEDWTCQKKDRKAQDSNWRLLGTNSYSNIRIDKETQFARTEKDSVLDKAPYFIYEYHPERAKYDRYVAASSLNRDFQSFNCYMVQFSGHINWNQYTQSEHDQKVAARRVVAENELTNAQMTLSLKKGNNTEDNTYIYMDARATTDFDNQMDLTKITDTRANQIYSVTNEVEYAGNTLPVEDQIVPLTVNINANGAYTFAMPEMTDGLEVYLMDNATNAHIDMAIDSYTVDLNKGKIADRFYLDVRVKERTTPTIIETIGTDGNPTGDRFIKVIQNDQLHIIRNGRIYNASGMELNR